MNEELMEISFGLIANAGEAKGLAFDALSKAKEGNFEEARELINKSREEMHKAHAFQTQLITKEASGGKNGSRSIINTCSRSFNECYEFPTIS